MCMHGMMHGRVRVVGVLDLSVCIRVIMTASAGQEKEDQRRVLFMSTKAAPRACGMRMWMHAYRGATRREDAAGKV